VYFRRRDVQPLGRVVERSRTDPADSILDGVQQRQEKMSTVMMNRKSSVTAESGPIRRSLMAGGSEFAVDNDALVFARPGAGEVKVQ
jgi:hypothetical protein